MTASPIKERQSVERQERIIEIRGVSKTFRGRHGDVHALRDVDLDIYANEFITVLGPSGCGKTTLLRLIAGLTKPDGGEVTLGGKRITGPGPDRSMVFQDFALMPWATVLTNVAFGLQVRGVAKSERQDRAMEYVRMVGLESFARSYPHELSGGMQQRVGIARALAVDPTVLLLDEPFSALDEQTRRLLQEQLLQMWEAQRKTVVFVTHSIEEAVLLGDRVVLMSARPGRVGRAVPVSLSRPRFESVDSPEGSEEFMAVTRDLWQSLRAQAAEAVETSV
ncbi:ABC transporter ATP-binding protein [Phytohabitans suffuscus]|uniref:ABC-type quaternary amine transporter n=1 Tax=Phytohabitans suffuscus TaxID=624315 RepID=A0A6F8YVE7_9ACTN|nr:ABC transporter ATP-binding protein [Phytohabitans suffuscus]BCB89908.1 ABC transporter ATP-binding protein [Phytohabitans suffuscus]